MNDAVVISLKFNVEPYCAMVRITPEKLAAKILAGAYTYVIFSLAKKFVDEFRRVRNYLDGLHSTSSHAFLH